MFYKETQTDRPLGKPGLSVPKNPDWVRPAAGPDPTDQHPLGSSKPQNRHALPQLERSF